MENVEFTDDEIREQLANLGYFDVSQGRLEQFRKDLQRLVEHDRSSVTSSWIGGFSPGLQSDSSPDVESQYPVLSRYQPHIPTFQQTSDSPIKNLSLQSSPKFEDSTSDKLPIENRPSASLHHNVDEMLPPFRVENREDSCSVRREDDVRMLNVESSSDCGRRIVCKRKVRRKQDNGESAVFDESLITDGESSYRIHDATLDDLSIDYGSARNGPVFPDRPHTARSESCGRSRYSESVREQQLPSYIRPNTSHPHTRNLRKIDRVNRHQQYRDAWNTVKAPGEKSHNALRWEVKAQMMFKDEPQPRPQRVFVPNTYVVPTSKKRSALRWEVRHAMERGMPVPSTFTVV